MEDGKEVSEGFYRIIQCYDQCLLDYPVEIIGYNGEDTTNTLWLDVNPGKSTVRFLSPMELMPS